MSKRIENISNGILLIGLAVLAYFNAWWPGILFVLGIYFAIRNILKRSYLKVLFNLALYGFGIFCFYYPRYFSWEYLLPLVFLVLGLERIIGEVYITKRNKS